VYEGGTGTDFYLQGKDTNFLVKQFKFAIELGSMFHIFSTFTHTQLCDSFIVSLNTADLTNRNPVSAAISRYNIRAKGLLVQ